MSRRPSAIVARATPSLRSAAVASSAVICPLPSASTYAGTERPVRRARSPGTEETRVAAAASPRRAAHPAVDLREDASHAPEVEELPEF